MQISRGLENLFLLIILTLSSSFIIDLQVGFILYKFRNFHIFYVNKHAQ